jgi:hypothetical protein
MTVPLAVRAAEYVTVSSSLANGRSLVMVCRVGELEVCPCAFLLVLSEVVVVE